MSDAGATRRIRALNVMGAAIADAERFEEVIELVAEETRRAIDADSLAICRYEPEDDRLRVQVSVGQLADGETRFPTHETYAMADIPRIAECLRSGRGYHHEVDDPALDPQERAIMQSLGKDSQAGVPIMVGGELWGEMWVGTVPGSPRLGAADLDLLKAVAGYVAIGVSRLELLDRLRALAMTDSLTGLENHRAFHEALDAAIATGAGFSVVCLDLDGFKAINDRHGHAEGDALLRRIARTVRGACRGDDRAFRIGGDELTLLLPGLDRAAAEAVVGRLRSRIAAAEHGVTASCGVACWPADGPSKDLLLLRADMEMYAAKRRRGSRTGQDARRPAPPRPERVSGR